MRDHGLVGGRGGGCTVTEADTTPIHMRIDSNNTTFVSARSLSTGDIVKGLCLVRTKKVPFWCFPVV